MSNTISDSILTVRLATVPFNWRKSWKRTDKEQLGDIITTG